MKLVVTPKPFETESLMGYLLHLTEANGYPSTSYIVSVLNGRWYGSSVGRISAAPLAELAGLNSSEVDRLNMLPDGLPRAFIRVYGHDLPSVEANCRTPKVCPLCLSEGRRCEAFWDLTQAVACPRHRVELVSECPKCAKQLRWSRKKTNECRCGSQLTEWPAKLVTDQLSGLMEAMQALTYQKMSATSMPGDWRHIEHLTLRQLCKLMWVLSYVIKDDGRDACRTKARSNYRQELEVVAEVLSDWPFNFRSFLEIRYRDVVSTATALRAFDRVFAWFVNGLINNVEGGPAAFQFVAAEVMRFAAGHWTRKALPRDLVASMPDLTFRWGTHNDAGEALDLHQVTLKKLIASGEITTKRVVGRGARSIVIDLEQARSIKHSQHPAVSVRDAAKEVGVSIETLKEMYESGLYEQKHRPSFPGSLTVEDVKELSSRLNSLFTGKRRVHGKGFISVDQAFVALSASPAEKAAIYGWLLESPSIVVGRLAKGEGLGRLQVARAVVEEYLNGIRIEDSCVTVRVAANQLGCSDATVTGLKRAGHLECRMSRGRLYPRKASVGEFDHDYESIAKLARRTGVASKRIYARLDFSKFGHVRVQTAQYVTVFVRRSDVPMAEGLIRELV
jgi:hypothetical protein